jgi:hypothetical protein
MEVVFERATLADVPELIAVQDLAFQEDFDRYGDCPSYRESPELMARWCSTPSSTR